ncbi:enoyl-CoA hydratase/isomerase family protein [Olivibacter sp. SDN3]|uniref:enoyl-CoA hydratase/isomerase family protein n=1 Tax=Olivibacter sp. SDN3 TaxID=2764720 RepID=UPI001650F5D7|nr:enoyl-CoA hydratase-related protein [Olivibacter sp. SDN3]QNL50707.1 enoyl-CoA hydratase/isomerase family protein [Olivibacter sp. SDN3]
MNYQHLLTVIASNILRVTINREQKLNALNKETLMELHDVLTKALSDTEVRGIILTGTGEKAFVAGADIREFSDFNSAEGRDLASDGQRKVFDLIHHAEKPIIAAINGFALGGGLELALACHIRVASHMARMGLPEVSLGLIPGYGGTQRLTQLVGRGNALEIILTGNMINAEKALQIGLVNHVVPADEVITKAEDILVDILLRSPNAVAAAIRAVNASLIDGQDGFSTEIEEFGNCFGTADFKEGVSAFLEKRTPVFNKK